MSEPVQVEKSLRRMASEFRRNAENTRVNLQQSQFALRAQLLDGAAGELEMLRDLVRVYEDVIADHERLVRELDVALNNDGAAKQASLCDIVSQVQAENRRRELETYQS